MYSPVRPNTASHIGKLLRQEILKVVTRQKPWNYVGRGTLTRLTLVAISQYHPNKESRDGLLLEDLAFNLLKMQRL